jgi:pimeloyl-ACP methyl ester carboxylesterase
MAQSDAVNIAVHAARDGRVPALILMGPSPGEILPEVNIDYREFVAETAKASQWALDVLAIQDPERRRTALADEMLRRYRTELAPADLARLHAMIQNSADLVLQRKNRPIPFADQLAAVNVPVLIVAAGRDRWVPSIARALAHRAPRGQLVLLDTAVTPWPWLAQSKAAAEAISDFLAEV